MLDGWTTVYDSRARQACSDRALVLLSVGIPNETLATEDGHCYLAVPEPLAEKARFEIWQYDQENQVQPLQIRALTPNYEGAIPGVLVYIIIVVLVASAASMTSPAADAPSKTLATANQRHLKIIFAPYGCRLCRPSVQSLTHQKN